MTRSTALLLVLGAALSAFGQNKPNFSGTWVFDAQKSALKVPPPSSMTLQIADNDPQITFTRTQSYGEQTFNWKLDATADGQKEVVDKAPGMTTNSKVYWQGSSLILDQKIVADDGTTITDMVTYTLGADGNTLTAVEKQTAMHGKGATTNKWVYEKKAQ
jgi:hypothetical protein